MRWSGLLFALVACHRAPPAAPVEAATPTHRPVAPARTPASKQVVTDTQVEILDPIRFYASSATIDPRSKATLDAVATTLLGDPSIKRMEVIAYGSDAVPSLQLSVAVARAEAIVGELVARGVSSDRLVASGQAAPPQGVGPGPTFLILERTD